MKSHVWRPLYVVIAFVVALLVFRYFYVPKDFGSGSHGFMYSFHRKANEQEWKNMPVRYMGMGKTQVFAYCLKCHSEEVKTRSDDLHGIIPCENCHGPALGHPEKIPKLVIDRRRDLCLRCHTALPYTTSERKRIPGINPKEHNPGLECVLCHNPHNPRLEDMRK